MNTVDLLRRLDEEFFEPALCAGVLSFAGKKHPVEILALSAHSADLRCNGEVAEDGPVVLSIDGFRSFEGELVRRHGRIIGMVFSDGGRAAPAASEPREAQSGEAPKAPPHMGTMRRHPRTAVFWSGTVQVGRESIDCIVLNMSAGGAKVKLFKRYPGGNSPLVLNIDRLGGYAAEVVWSQGEMIGVRFLKDPELVAADIERELGRTNPNRTGSSAAQSIAAPAPPGPGYASTS